MSGSFDAVARACKSDSRHARVTVGWLQRIQQVFRNALALCQAVHLLNAKALDQQFANMCLLQPDPAPIFELQPHLLRASSRSAQRLA